MIRNDFLHEDLVPSMQSFDEYRGFMCFGLLDG